MSGEAAPLDSSVTNAIVRRAAEDDRDVLEKGVRAFVSYVRGYREHVCKYIFRYEVPLRARPTQFITLPPTYIITSPTASLLQIFFSYFWDLISLCSSGKALSKIPSSGGYHKLWTFWSGV